MNVVYLTAGQGIRANLGYPKQYQYIGGKPLFIHGIEILNSIKEIDRIIIVADDSHQIYNINEIMKIVFSYACNKCEIIKGGSTRQESVFEGLKYVTTDEVLICEAVRPFITKEFVRNIIKLNGNVVPYTKLNSTPFNKKTGKTYKRDDVVCVQTPQKYNTRELINCHEFALSQNINCTDDLDLMKKTSQDSNFTFIEGLIDNIKITYPSDLIIANALFNYKGVKDE
jgi:2-C-methyl-D-erythritol 4-phosphate cytidylyltransferase